MAATARLVPALIAAVALAACATPRGTVSPPPPPAERPSKPSGAVYTGYASWYGRWHHGRLTTSGEVYDMYQLTAAHPSLPLGTRLRVTNLRNGRSVDVRVNDRGPAVDGRVLDMSYAAAKAVGAVQEGVVPVRYRILSSPP